MNEVAADHNFAMPQSSHAQSQAVDELKKCLLQGLPSSRVVVENANLGPKTKSRANAAAVADAKHRQFKSQLSRDGERCSIVASNQTLHPHHISVLMDVTFGCIT